ncbi:MAG: polymerase primary sigma factor, partial [Acidobacteriota bacterium]|nr:polymerase primary sigma factor [Acidobacteriota bacterium]
MSIEEKDQDDVVQRLLELGTDKKFLTFDDLNRELPDNIVSPDDIEDVLQKLNGANIAVADSEERLIEQAAVVASTDDEEIDEDVELDLSAGALEKTNDPVRLYLREMGVVPLLTREGEVSIAKRIERGQLKTQKAISRSPIAVCELLKIGDGLEAGKLNIRDVVGFSDQAELTGQEDKAEEYYQWTLEGIGNIRRLFKAGLKDWDRLRAETKVTRGKKTKKLLRLRRKVARARLEIAQLIAGAPSPSRADKGLNLTERARQRLINSIRTVALDVRSAERDIEKYTEKLGRKRLKAEDEREYKRQISA